MFNQSHFRAKKRDINDVLTLVRGVRMCNICCQNSSTLFIEKLEICTLNTYRKVFQFAINYNYLN